MNKLQTYAEQLARKDIEALDDNDKKLKELLGEYHDEEITNLKNMTKQTPTKLEELIEEGKSFFEKIKGFRFDSYDSNILREEPWLRLKGKIKEYEFEAFIKKVYEAGGEAERIRIEKGIKPAIYDFTGMGKVLIKRGFEGAGNEVIENVGYIKSLFIKSK